MFETFLIRNKLKKKQIEILVQNYINTIIYKVPPYSHPRKLNNVDTKIQLKFCFVFAYDYNNLN